MANEQEKQEPKEPTYVEMETAPVEIPQYGDTLPARVSRLGLTTADQIFGKEARNPEQKVLMVFFESEDGVKGKTPLAFYPHPSPKSKIARFVRKFGQPKVGMAIQILRDENGYWGVNL
jgi:hypothetical protein